MARNYHIPEDTDHYCYRWFYIDTNITCYIGEGSGGRMRGLHAENLEKLRRDNLVDCEIIEDGLTKGGAETVETSCINKCDIQNIPLLNKQGGKSSVTIDIYEKSASVEENVTSLIDGAIHTGEIVDKPTPVCISNELIDNIINTVGFELSDKKWLNPNCRFGEMNIPLCNKVGFQNIKNNITMVDNTANLLVFQGSRNMGEAKMNEIICINEDFGDWHTTERYDVIIMNPPFKGVGGKFIMKCVGLLKDGGFLGVVMSPFWRSITTRTQGKVYNKMLQQGSFHMIHMYSQKDTSDMFKQNIGQVDTFVWQKGVTNITTKIINQRGDEYSCDLNNYPQAPPVLPSYTYDQHFDQNDGLKWYRYPANGGNTRKNPMIHTFIDITTGKDFKCCDKCVIKSKGKKVIIDQSLKQYHVDDIGDIVVNDRYMFFFDSSEERDAIITSLQFVIDNKDLFRGKENAWVPAIKK